ncbi:hypothetical protein ABKV19_009665 [Rosa sericea]
MVSTYYWQIRSKMYYMNHIILHGPRSVTCIQFNPLDDSVFLSGSLDAKFRLWDIPDRRMVDWTDLHEMVTAACYTPEGQLTVDFGGRILSVSIDVPGKDTYHIQPR